MTEQAPSESSITFSRIDWHAFSEERGWVMPPPRYGATWTEQESADLRETWGVLTVEELARRHGRGPQSITGQAQKLGLIPKPEKAAQSTPKAKPMPAPASSREVVVRAPRATPASAVLEPRVAALCASGLPELCAKVIDLAACGVTKPMIAQHLVLSKGLGSVSAHFQKAGLVWGIGGNGAHAVIIEHARTLLRNV